MKILLDENLDHRIRHILPPQEVQTTRYAGFNGLKNGKLLKAAETAGFEVLITGDKTLHHEQNLAAHAIKVVVLSNLKLESVRQCAPIILAAIADAKTGVVTVVDCGIFSRKRTRATEAKPVDSA